MSSCNVCPHNTLYNHIKYERTMNYNEMFAMNQKFEYTFRNIKDPLSSAHTSNDNRDILT